MIKKKFAEIVGVNGVAIVVTVGDDLKFNELKKEYLERFKSHDNCIFPPTIVSFTKEEGKKLKNANVKWTLNSPAVESEVVNKLDEEKSFVFYRNGSFSGVNEDTRKAFDVAFYEICWNHYLLVVGDNSGLEEELKKDIKIVAALADVSDDDLQLLLNSLRSGFNRIYGKNGVFTLLISPSNSVLKEKLKEFILHCPNFSLTIIYSGHNEKDFGWVLAEDERFSGSDLKQLLQDVKPQHYPEIYILLNCCYGFAFAENVRDLKTLIACLQELLQGENFLLNLEILKRLEDFPADDKNKIDEWFKDNERITCALCRIAKTTSASQIDSLPYKISLVPFAIGPLEPQGILSETLVENKYTNLDWSKQLRTPPKKLQLYSEVSDPKKSQLCSEVSDPQLFVFAAGNGDSTLFRWHDFNMLIDGGIATAPPCFWRTVQQLQKLDVVVVTHYDQDHIAGILRLFQEDPLPIDVGELYSTEPPHCSGTRSPKQGRLLWDLARNYCRKNLVFDPTKAIITKEFNGNYRLRIFMLTPTKEKLEKATEMMRRCRGLTVPNEASASLLIECRINEDTFKYALLTGDAPGEDIIGGLDKLKQCDQDVNKNCYCLEQDHYRFDYIDMPHHGSKQNSPQHFLSKISTKVCVVSTNGKRYNHPDVETLCELSKAITSDKIEYLLFTYCDKRPPETGDRIISELKDDNCRKIFSEETKEKSLFFANNNPEDKDCKQCFLVKLTSPVKPWQIWDIPA